MLLTVMLPSNRFHRFYELPQDALIEINAFITSNLPELTTSLFSFRISER
jgi:hypothetical protein